ncbi:hypothetical protein Vretifemale_13667 [Volvox reticuliferus]|uniref:Uncharacterized protein n=1 Tax=Volvox reticuliferus TaxID=1737510 RepID=A0A8J4FUP6_9CHLO|nr:hypothetical protein Vretifemale_13667 [Volvox reticuliferus]
MLETYEARGISMDRALYWEAQAAPGPNLLAGVPPHMFPAFAFYNIPAPQELTDGRNPLNVIAKIAKPEDFVSIKLDIDHPGIEDIWLRAILGNNSTPVTAGVAKSVYAQLIDELFWEHHFNFMPMRVPTANVYNVHPPPYDPPNDPPDHHHLHCHDVHHAIHHSLELRCTDVLLAGPGRF